MGTPFDVATVEQLISQACAHFIHHVLSWGSVAQLVVLGSALLLARKLSGGMHAWLRRQQEQYETSSDAGADLAKLLNSLKVIESFIAFVLVAIAYGIAIQLDWSVNELFAAGILLIALTLKRLFSDVMNNSFWAKTIANAIWVYGLLLAALVLFNLFDSLDNFLRNVVFQVGEVSISLLKVSRACFLLLSLYWLYRNLQIFSHFLLTVKSGLTAAGKILWYRLCSILLFSACVVLVLHYLGLDFTVFALFGGALGLGLGFGLQKIFANLVCGFILLADKSIKPGDVIQLGDKFGWINFLGSRYVSVVTRNGTEHLIPNENLITSEVINWSYSQNLIRLHVPVGVAYGSDLEKAKELMLETAADTKRVLDDPGPACFFTGFGDNAVNLDLRVWINDPQIGLAEVKSDLFWGIWKRFREHGIEIPYPQRDVHLTSIPEIRVRIEPEEGQ